MIKKLTLQDNTRIVCEKDFMLALRYVQNTVNQLVDAVNGILDYAPLEMAMKAEPEKVNMDIESPVVKMWKEKLDKIERENRAKIDRQIVETLIRPSENVQQVSYTAPGDITVFHGFNCSVEFDIPLPKGTRITIKSITKGGDNE